MQKSFRNAVLANTVAFLAASQCGKAAHVPGTEQTLSIHLYNEAQAPPGVVRLGTEEAARLLSSAGIRTSWEQPSAEAPEDRGTNMTSAELSQPDDRPYVVVRLIALAERLVTLYLRDGDNRSSGSHCGQAASEELHNIAVLWASSFSVLVLTLELSILLKRGESEVSRLPEREPESNSDLDKQEEEDRTNEEDDEDEELDRQERQDDEDDDEIYSDDMRASP